MRNGGSEIKNIKGKSPPQAENFEKWWFWKQKYEGNEPAAGEKNWNLNKQFGGN